MPDESSVPVISAIICTLDRGPAIAQTIDALVAQKFPAERYEILIVDNGSSLSNTEILLAQAQAHPEKIRYVREDRIGESSARNCGVRESRSRYLAFIDDDAIASPAWLSSLCQAFDDDQKLGAIGGRVLLKFAEPPPAWFSDDLLPYLSVFDYGESPRTLAFPDYPRGANMAFRREAFGKDEPFSVDLGLQGSCLLSMSETEMCYRVAEQGWTIAYNPQASVEHMIPASRLDRAWFARRIHWQGRSRLHFELMHQGRWHVLGRIPGQVWGLIHKRGMQRHLHLGYLAGLPSAILSVASSAPTSSQKKNR